MVEEFCVSRFLKEFNFKPTIHSDIETVFYSPVGFQVLTLYIIDSLQLMQLSLSHGFLAISYIDYITTLLAFYNWHINNIV